MSNWFHHDPASGRNGPFSTEGLLERYRRRLIQADTLVWREGLREWLTLERAMADLDTVLGPQDTSAPPPLPNLATPAYPPAMAASGPQRMPAGARPMAPQKKGMSGCLIAAIVVGVFGVVAMGVVAAIALPAYNDYTKKAKVYGAIGSSNQLQQAIVDFVGRTGACPALGDDGFADLTRFTTPQVPAIELGVRADGVCQYAMSLPGTGDGSQPGVAVMSMVPAPGGYAFEFDCQASTVARRYQPTTCTTEEAP